MMTQTELWDIRPQGSNPCRDMRRYKLKPRKRFLSVDELKRLGFVLDHSEAAHPENYRVSEAEDTLWDGALAHFGGRAQSSGVKSFIVQVRVQGRMRKLTPGRFPEASLARGPQGSGNSIGPHLDRRSSSACPQGQASAVPRLRRPLPRAAQKPLEAGLTVGRLLGHRRRTTTAIHAHLDDGALRNAAAQAAGVIGRAMKYKAEPPPLPEAAENDSDNVVDWLDSGETPAALPSPHRPSRPAAKHQRLDRTDGMSDPGDSVRHAALDWMAEQADALSPAETEEEAVIRAGPPVRKAS